MPNDRNYTGKSVTEIFKNSIITPVPDKSIEMIGNFIMIAFKNTIIYIDVSKHGINERE